MLQNVSEKVFLERLSILKINNSNQGVKNDTSIVENTNKNTIFVYIKTTYLSHRHIKIQDRSATLAG